MDTGVGPSSSSVRQRQEQLTVFGVAGWFGVVLDENLPLSRRRPVVAAALGWRCAWRTRQVGIELR
jgi:hypothetical protein